MVSKKTELNILPAFHGDCILIKTYDRGDKEYNILIDGGTSQTFKYSLKSALENLDHLDLLIITHIDSDHIGGILQFFSSSLIQKINIKEIWINHPELIELTTGELISVKQGEDLKGYIANFKPSTILKTISTLDGVIDKNGIKFTILSPTTEIISELYRRWEIDKVKNIKFKNIGISNIKKSETFALKDLANIPFNPSKTIFEDIFNASSISFLLECPDLSVLLLADSRAEIIENSLSSLHYTSKSPLKVDYIKISHHGSLNNTSQSLLKLLKCNKFIISTNGGSSNHRHPSSETLARIIYNSSRTQEKVKIFLNYELVEIEKKNGPLFLESDRKDGNWQIEYRTSF